MAKILVIDSDAQLRDTLRQFFSARGFQSASVPNGVEAARLMRHDAPDLIVIDQEVPLGGIKTAQIVRMNPRYERIPILLGLKAGPPDQVRATLHQAIKSGVAWALPRPYNPDRLLEKVKEKLHVKKADKKEETALSPEATGVRLRKQVREIVDLPTLSVAQQHLITLMSRDDSEVDMNELIEAIQADQALTMRTLRIARSAGYGYQGNLLPSAVTYLGIQKIRQIVQSTTILEVFGTESKGGLDLLELWKHSIACGHVMQIISRDNKQSRHFMAGLLHDVGKLILETRFTPYAKVIHELATREHRPRYEIETEMIGITHAEIGQEVAALWQLPHELSEAIAFHHMPSQARRHKQLTALVYLADVFVRQMGIGTSGNDLEPVINDPFAQKVRLPVTVEKIHSQREEIQQRVDAILEV